ncbi:MAG: hypothetical protein JXO49_07460 [Deltaproteobacteria bacterium]|nr:hypothetical protein [Candidatus Anaeroferrophillus wilburensis]MBN2889166.1 hypothetical protein [Deltaproteobacteria bacterium]
MDRFFYEKFIRFCQDNQENLDNMKTLVESTLNTPVCISIASPDGLPIIAVKLLQKGKIRHTAGGFATIPASFDDERIRLLPLFVYETEAIDDRFLSYEACHIEQFLDKKGEYANYKEFFLQAPTSDSPEKQKLEYLRHVCRRVLINEQPAFPLLHPGKEEKTLRSLIVYQLAERISWYCNALEMDREIVINALIPTLEGMVKHDPFYAESELVELFQQTMVSLTMFA